MSNATTTKRLSKKELAVSAAKHAKRLGLAKPMPAARSETVPDAPKTEQGKTVKAKKTPKPSKQPVLTEAPKVETAPEDKPEKTARENRAGAPGRDQWGSKIGTGSNYLNRAVAELADRPEGAPKADIIKRAEEIAKKEKGKTRGAEGSLLNALRLAGFAEPLGGGVWRVTEKGAAAWKAGKAADAGLAKMVAKVAE